MAAKGGRGLVLRFQRAVRNAIKTELVNNPGPYLKSEFAAINLRPLVRVYGRNLDEAITRLHEPSSQSRFANSASNENPPAGGEGSPKRG